MQNEKANKVTGHQLGVFFLLAYVVCMVWYAVHPIMRELHVDLFRLSFLGFDEMDALSMFFGAVQTYLWGHIFMFLWNVSNAIAGRRK